MLSNTGFRCGSWLPLFFIVTFTGCGGGGGGGGGNPPAAAASAPPQQTTFTLTGSVGDGPVAGADLVFTDKNGQVIATTTSSDDATYSVELPDGAEAPIRISASGGTDLVTGRPLDFELISLENAGETGTVNVSPVTTVLAQSFDCAAASSEPASVDKIWDAARNELSLGLQPEQFADPISQSVTPESAAAFVLVNEALGEVIRRSARIISEQRQLSEFDAANDVVSALACDLTDGAFDGESAQGPLSDSDKALLGVVRTMDTLVRLELLTGSLTVDGDDATARMDAAIDTIQPTATTGVNDVPLADDALTEALDGLSALKHLDDSNELTDLVTTLANDPQDVAAAQISQALEGGLDEKISVIGAELLTLSAAQVAPIIRLQPAPAEGAVAASDVEVEQSTAPDPVSSSDSSDTTQESSIGDQQTPAEGAQQQTDETAVPTETPQSEAEETPVEAAAIPEESTPEAQAEESPDESATPTESDAVESEAPATKPTVSVVANTTVVSAGSYVELEWSSTDTSSCTATGAWDGDKPTTGDELVGPVNQASTYVLSCDGSGGTAVAMTEISALGTVQLSWKAPEKNTDGTKVKGLKHFKVYHGKQSRNYDNAIEVQGNKRAHTVELPVGDYFFAVSAIDLEGDESALSNEIIDTAE